MGVETIKDLLYHFPSRYTDAATDFEGSLVKGETVTLTGTLEKINKRRTRGKRRMMISEGAICTEEKKIKAIWFNQPYIAHQYSPGDVVEVTGKVSGDTKPYLTNPTIKHATKTAETQRQRIKEELTAQTRKELFAIYPETRYVSSLWIRSQIEKVLSEEEIKNIQDPIPEAMRNRLNLPDLYSALIYTHKPRNQGEHEGARKRFMFEQTFMLQVAQQISKNKRLKSRAYNLSIDTKKTDEFIKQRFEFTPTKDQKQAIQEILKDIHSNKPMSRLLEGDVGSGKTAVAAAVMHGVVSAEKEEEAGGKPQCAYLAPTEVLAKQQFNTLVALFSHLPIQIGFIGGKECLKYPSKIDKEKPTRVSKTQLKKWIASGEIAVIVGTHAIIQKDVRFKRLALIIIDEQHRFGVAQRQKLTQSTGTHVPHLLSMTATPIPRTLALTIYGDLDISVLQKVPSERKPVKTKLLRSENVQKAYDHIQEEVKKGHQAYILCPRIEKDRESPLRSTEEEYEHVSKNIFPDLSIGTLHGKMKQKEKQTVMEDFKNGKIDVLVCTTVVEVGVNVPNTTIMTVLHAERFGLAQLHQIRGRVIRSSHQPYCYAITDTKNELTLERLKTFETIHNGFTLAQKDLDMRGSGELAGLRQSGIPDLVMEGLKNPKLVEIARREAAGIAKSDPTLKSHSIIKRYIKSRKIHNE